MDKEGKIDQHRTNILYVKRFDDVMDLNRKARLEINDDFFFLLY